MSSILAPITSSANLYPEEIFAFILLSTKEGSISSLSQRVLDLKNNKIDTRYIALRSSPDGVYSEDIDRYISFLLTFKYAQQRSPIRLTPKGEELCLNVARKALQRNPKIATEVARILKYDVSKLAK
jgi:hypothetical protein